MLKEKLKIDVKTEAELVQEFMNRHVHGTPKRDGILVGISGGIDSAVVVSLAVKAVGKDKVFGLLLPEKGSNPISAEYAEKLCQKLGIKYDTFEITEAVKSFGAYDLQTDIIRKLVDSYDDTCKFNIRLPQNLLDQDRYNFYTLTVEDKEGNRIEKRLNKNQVLSITAAANVKIRSRMIALYLKAESMNYLVAGTTNKTEFLLGDFCKFGDGGTDLECVSHLYKTNIYDLGRYLDVPKEIIDRMPSPDTFSLPVSDIEFYFCLPFDILDPLLYAWEYKSDPDKTAAELNLTKEQIERVFRDFDSKFKATEHIRQLPYAIERDWSKI